MDIETNVFEVYDFEELKRKMGNSANKTLLRIEEKGLEDIFLNMLNELLRVNIDSGIPMSLNELDDFIDFEIDTIESWLNTKLWED